MTDISDTISILNLPGDNRLDPLMKIYREQILFGSTQLDKFGLAWEQVDKVDNNCLYVSGLLAKRMLNLLSLKPRKLKKAVDYIYTPNCHGAALYCMGFVDYLDWINPLQIDSIYGSSVRYIVDPQKPPAIVHFVDEDVSFKRHSIVYLGKLGSKEICFEKRGEHDAMLSKLEDVEKAYGKSKLYVIH